MVIRPYGYALWEGVQGWLEGGAQSGAPVFADVRDVARAHVLAVEVPEAKGRYIVANSHSTPSSLIAAWFQVGERRPDGAHSAHGAHARAPSSALLCFVAAGALPGFPDPRRRP
jgi:nucleoside-diphosphate-sugar epimerase